MAAAAAALAMGLDREAVATGLRSFAGVPHRLEPVAERRGVSFVNDSKATNVASATVGAALPSTAGVHAILGGSERARTFGALVAPVRERCAAALPDRRHRRPASADGARAASRRASRCTAARTSRTRSGAPPRQARPGEVVLLSPACASFDAFEDFEQRGDRFREIVEALRERARAAVARAAAGRRRRARGKRAAEPPAEYNMLLTATLCLLALGAVMVFSASSTTRVLSDGGLSDGALYLKRTLMFGAARPAAHARRRPLQGSSGAAPRPPRSSAVSFLLVVAVLGGGDAASTARAAGSAPASSRSSPRRSPRSP